MPGPLTPPPPLPSVALRFSMSIASPTTVFTSTSASAPASIAAPAIATRSGVFGLNFTHRGTPATFVARTISLVADAE